MTVGTRSSQRVLLQFVAEAVFLSVSGGLAGIVMGMVLSAGISVIFGCYLERKAVRLDLIEALEQGVTAMYTGNECMLIVNDTPYGNERSYNGLRLTIIRDRVQEPRP